MSSVSSIYNLSGDQGSTFQFAFQWTQNGIPVDLTNWTGHMQLREKYNSTGIAAEAISTGNSMNLTSSGVVNVLLDKDQMSNLLAKTYLYDLDLSSGDFRKTLIRGSFLVIPEVTR